MIIDFHTHTFPDSIAEKTIEYLSKTGGITPHRDGTVAQPAKGNIFKGPFHIPRMLVKTWELTKDL